MTKSINGRENKQELLRHQLIQAPASQDDDRVRNDISTTRFNVTESVTILALQTPARTNTQIH